MSVGKGLVAVRGKGTLWLSEVKDFVAVRVRGNRIMWLSESEEMGLCGCQSQRKWDFVAVRAKSTIQLSG